MTARPFPTIDVKNYFANLGKRISASEEYVFLRNTFVRLCVFTAIVFFTVAGNSLIEVVAGRLEKPANWVLSFVELLILLADALWFTVSLTREIADWLEKLGLTDPERGGRPAIIIVILLSVVAVGGVVFRPEANKTWHSVDAVRIAGKP